VGTDVDGLPETLGAGRGIVVPPEDPEALAAAIDDVLTGLRQTDLAAARAYARTFAAERVAAVYAAAYRALLVGRRPGIPDAEAWELRDLGGS
jgi:glycosyltransferase involved in cell wall biosynthesis